MLVFLQDTCCLVQYVLLVLVMASAIDQSFLGHNEGLNRPGIAGGFFT